MSSYVSPYGFGPVTDAVLDCVAERHGVDPEEIVAKLERRLTRDDDRYASVDSVISPATVRDWIEDEAWDAVLGPAVDRFDEKLFPQDTSR